MAKLDIYKFILPRQLCISCFFRRSKQAVYRSFDAIFGKVGRIASEEVVLELLKKKCLPVLLYLTETCPMKKSLISSLQFAVSSRFVKMFNIRSKAVIEESSSSSLTTVGSMPVGV